MITRTNKQIVVNAAGLVPACAWCVSVAERNALRLIYQVTDGLCTSCQQQFEREVA